MWKLVPALTIQHIIPCMNSTEPLEIYMLLGQMEESVMWWVAWFFITSYDGVYYKHTAKQSQMMLPMLLLMDL